MAFWENFVCDPFFCVRVCALSRHSLKCAIVLLEIDFLSSTPFSFSPFNLFLHTPLCGQSKDSSFPPPSERSETTPRQIYRLNPRPRLNISLEISLVAEREEAPLRSAPRAVVQKATLAWLITTKINSAAHTLPLAAALGARFPNFPA